MEGLDKVLMFQGGIIWCQAALVHVWSDPARGGSWARELQRCSLALGL